jgi:hypothetical protein
MEKTKEHISVSLSKTTPSGKDQFRIGNINLDCVPLLV